MEKKKENICLMGKEILIDSLAICNWPGSIQACIIYILCACGKCRL